MNEIVKNWLQKYENNIFRKMNYHISGDHHCRISNDLASDPQMPLFNKRSAFFESLHKLEGF